MASNAEKTRNTLIQNLWFLVLPYRSQVKKALTWIFINEILNLVEPAIMMVLIDEVTKQSKAPDINHMMFLGMIVLAFLVYSAFYLAVRLKNKWVFKILNAIEYDILINSMDKLLRMPPAYYEQENSGKVVGKLHQGVGKSIEVIWDLAFSLLPTVASFVIVTVVLFASRYQAGLALMVVIAIFIFTQHALKKRIEPIRKDLADLREDANASAAQAMENIDSVQAFSQEEREHNRIISLLGEKKDLEEREFAIMEKWGLANRLTFDFGRLSVFAICAYGVFSGGISFGELFFVLMLAGRAMGSAENLNRVYKRVLQSKEDIGRTLQILKYQSTHLSETIEASDSEELANADIAIKNVSYTYPIATATGLAIERGSEPALKKVSVTISANSMVGIVGLSGSGKTTLLKMLRRSDDPDSGEILFGETDLRDIDPAQLCRRIAVVGKTDLFNTTIAKNIAYGKPQATDDEILQAAAQANAHEFISELPKGYRTVIGNQGARLSEGQKQRICLARALLLEPNILLLDEPLNHLDAESAYQVKKSIDLLRGKCTIVHVTHQLWSVRDAEQIVVMDQGRVLEHGTHAYLMKKRGLYATLFQRQSLQHSEILGLFSQYGIN